MHETPEPAPAIGSPVEQNDAVHVAHILARILGAPIATAHKVHNLGTPPDKYRTMTAVTDNATIW
jgi:hypothetical protein